MWIAAQPALLNEMFHHRLGSIFMLIAAGENPADGQEYALRSGDEIDVFFKSGGTWIGVEVKVGGIRRKPQRGL